MSDKINRIIPYFLYLATGIFLILLAYKLISAPFTDWDEAIYAYLAGKNNLLSFEIYYNDKIWLEKPVLLFKFWQVLYQIGHFEIVSRMANLAIITLIIMFVTKIIKQSTDTKSLFNLTLMFFFGLIFSHQIFFSRLFVLNTDTYLALSVLGLIYFRKSFTLSTMFLIIGIGAKSLLGFIALFSVILYELLISLKNKSFAIFNLKYFLKFIAQILIALHWHIYMYLISPKEFVREHLQDHLLARLSKPIELHFGGRLYYIDQLFNSFSIIGKLILAWGFLLLILFTFKKLSKSKFIEYIFHSKNANFVILLVYTIINFILLTLTKTKISWYLYPSIITSVFCFALIVGKIHHKIFRGKYMIFTYMMLSLLLIMQWENIFNTLRPNLLVGPSLMAECINQNTNSPEILFAVSKQERQNANVLEASNLIISTSLRYGGSPSLLYYSNPKVNITYSPKITFTNNSEIYILYSSEDQNIILSSVPNTKEEQYCQNSEYTFSKITQTK